MLELAVTVADALRSATARLAEAGCESPGLDAELLLGEVLGCDRAGLVLRASEALGGDVLTSFERLIDRRAAREPVAYILGRKSFRHLVLEVDRRVLIPRPETELLVEVGLELTPGESVVDVGTGSGAVALALKDERPDLEIVATDISAKALEVARANAARLELDVRFVEGDLLAGVDAAAVLANLPYVASGDELAPDVRCYEPAGALFGGADGFDLIRRLICGAPSSVSLLALELDPAQVPMVGTLLAGAGFARVDVLEDLAGRARVVVGRR